MEIPAWLATISPAGALVIIMMLIATGKLIPEKIHDRIMGSKDAQIAAQQKVTDKLLAQSDKSLENDETMLHLLRSLPSGTDVEVKP